MSWTDDRVSLLRRLWGEGRTAAEIAKELGGVTRNAVIGKAHRLKLSNRVSPIQQNKKPTAKPATEQRKVLQDNAVSAVSGVIAIVKQPIRVRPEIRTENLMSLMDLKPRMCRWPVGDPREEGFGFCGCDAVSGLPYCPDHAKVAYQAATRNRILHAEQHAAQGYDAEAEEYAERDASRVSA